MEQSNLLELAKQGEPTAIAALMNAVLSPKGITAHAEMEQDCLCILLESQKPLNQETLVEFIQKGLQELGNGSIRLVRTQGKTIGEEGFAWTREFLLRSSEPSARVATLTPSVKADEEDSEDEEEELDDESLSFRGWLKTRWRVYAIPVALVVVGGFIAGGTTAFWSTAKSQSQNSVEAVLKPRQDSAEAKQKEAETYLKAMMSAQKDFYHQKKRFATSLEELERSASVISQSYSYAYRLRVGTDSMIAAIPRESDLKSYIGTVTITPSGTDSLICRSLKPSVQAPEKPKAVKGSKTPVCPARSQKI